MCVLVSWVELWVRVSAAVGQRRGEVIQSDFSSGRRKKWAPKTKGQRVDFQQQSTSRNGRSTTIMYATSWFNLWGKIQFLRGFITSVTVHLTVSHSRRCNIVPTVWLSNHIPVGYNCSLHCLRTHTSFHFNSIFNFNFILKLHWITWVGAAQIINGGYGATSSSVKI